MSKTEATELDFFEEPKGLLDFLILKGCMIADITDLDSDEIQTWAEIVSAQSTEAHCHSAFAVGQ